MVNLKGKTVCITGSARRIGKQLVLAAARNGASIILHYGRSKPQAENTAEEIRKIGAKVTVVQADFSDPRGTLNTFKKTFQDTKNLYALVNNASIFESTNFIDTDLDNWQKHLDINLTVPFLLSQAFHSALNDRKGRIINILDWRALRPGKDHFPYIISKAALTALTKSLALALAPQITVNGIALGAILPPSDGTQHLSSIIEPVPMNRWADMEELIDLFLYLLSAPEYITGEIIHLDGGRHLV